ncbi:MAG TPA: hypothetical protein VFC10_09285 [Terriglobia bacterium]|nr:hypothetical protein [Terriglobia bacterium]
MDKRYSVIADMYGTAPTDDIPTRYGRGWLFVLLVLAVVFVILSIRPIKRLRPDPPPSVLGTRAYQGQTENESRGRMARACWDYAIETVQKTYPFGQNLPEHPPSRFSGPNGQSSAISLLCWPRLRVAWTQKDSWVQSYEWSTDWITDPDGPIHRAIHTVLNYLGF